MSAFSSSPRSAVTRVAVLGRPSGLCWRSSRLIGRDLGARLVAPRSKARQDSFGLSRGRWRLPFLTVSEDTSAIGRNVLLRIGLLEALWVNWGLTTASHHAKICQVV